MPLVPREVFLHAGELSVHPCLLRGGHHVALNCDGLRIVAVFRERHRDRLTELRGPLSLEQLLRNRDRLLSVADVIVWARGQHASERDFEFRAIWKLADRVFEPRPSVAMAFEVDEGHGVAEPCDWVARVEGERLAVLRKRRLWTMIAPQEIRHCK